MHKWIFLVFLAAPVAHAALAGAGARGLRPIEIRAEKGDATAQLVLGELYQYGFGLANHKVPALTWYLVSAHEGNAEAKARAAALAARMAPADVGQARAASTRLLRAIRVSAVPPLPAPPATP